MPSSVIKAFSYDDEGQVLTITFVSGRVYAYQGVPADVAQGLRLAFAKGEYFNKAIRVRFAATPVAADMETRLR
ncbi:MAG TPA: KTSC domain-containing protein [Caulobacter sp.]|nr:KTSC domain-containing protein [Caulobacter sp.]